MTHFLITGASGFIGSHLIDTLKARGYPFRGVSRQPATTPDFVQIGAIDDGIDWQAALAGCDVVIHLAARAHVLNETSADPLSEFKKVNTAGTINLAEQAADAGIKRFVFVSSIGVNGESTPVDQPFTEASPPAPQLPYAQSKWEAEQALWDIAERTNMEVVIVRPSLVYGPNAPGNFGRLVRLVKKGLPLPFGATNNRRSFIAVQNLADFLVSCALHPNAKNETFLIDDGEAISTTELVRRIGLQLGHTPPLLPVSGKIISPVAKVLGRERMVNQLWGSLVIDSSKAQQRLHWQPSLTMQHALQEIV